MADVQKVYLVGPAIWLRLFHLRDTEWQYCDLSGHRHSLRRGSERYASMFSR